MYTFFFVGNSIFDSRLSCYEISQKWGWKLLENFWKLLALVWIEAQSCLYFWNFPRAKYVQKFWDFSFRIFFKSVQDFLDLFSPLFSWFLFYILPTKKKCVYINDNSTKCLVWGIYDTFLYFYPNITPLPIQISEIVLYTWYTWSPQAKSQNFTPPLKQDRKHQ